MRCITCGYYRNEDKRLRRYVTYMGVLSLLLIVLAGFNLLSVSSALSADELHKLLFQAANDSAAYRIVMDIRLPRLLAAVFLGGALAVSGFLLQTFFHNPIAGPFVLGISSGAKLVVAITMIFLLGHGIHISALGMVGAALIGSFLTMGFVLVLSYKVERMSLLVVCGIMVGYICSAVTDFFVTFADDSNIVNLHNWSMGTFSGIGWRDTGLFIPFVVVTVGTTFILSKPIGAYSLGEGYAQSLGVNIPMIRVAMILLSSILSATVTAFAGPISFVGIAVPHLVKSAIKSVKPILMIPACFLTGAVVTLFCDGVARWIFSPTELSISSVTAIFLVPVVIWMMLHRQEGRGRE